MPREPQWRCQDVNVPEILSGYVSPRHQRVDLNDFLSGAEPENFFIQVFESNPQCEVVVFIFNLRVHWSEHE